MKPGGWFAKLTPVPRDAALQVVELRAAGLNWCRVSVVTGIPRSTCKHIADGKQTLFSDDLTARQRTKLLRNLQPA